MNSTVYQLTLIIGMGTLTTLLIRGMSLRIALYRSVVVILVVLGLLIVASFIVRWATTYRPDTTEINESSTDLEAVEEPE